MKKVFVLIALVLCGCSADPPQIQTVSREYILSTADSIGVELGDTSYVFGVFRHCMDSQGDILILDTSSRSVRRFSEAGDHLVTLGLAGSGPGEFNLPRNIAPLPGGGFLLSSEVDRKLCIYSRDMELVSEIVNTSGSLAGPFRSAALTDTTFVSRFYSISEDSVTGSLCIQSSQGDDVPTVLREKVVLFDGEEQWHEGASFMFATSPDGTVFAAEYSCDSWRVEHLSSEGNLINVLERKYLPQPFTHEEIIFASDAFRRRYIHAYNTDAGFEYIPPEFRYSIESLAVDGEGNLWVESGTEATSEYRIYSPVGQFMFKCTFDPPIWQLSDGWQVSIDRNGYLASPMNPEMYPLLYSLNIQNL